jgi:DNA-binding NtrC family response regulator
MTDAMTVLIVDDEEDARWALSAFVQKIGFVALVAESGRDALATLSMQSVDVVLLDVRMPDQSGGEVLQQIRQLYDIPVIMLTGDGNVQDAAASLRQGANNYLTKPYDHQILERSLRDVLTNHVSKAADQQNELLKVEALSQLIESMGMGDKSQRLIHSIKHVAPTNLTVLLHGETGTGKELVSRAIHDLSSLNNMPFIALDCGAIPESLIESELFGHEKGAFTGAVKSRQGVFELAQGGTLFLDEISSLPLPMQARLIRVVEAREFRRVGGMITRQLNIRIIASSNVNLQAMMEKKQFRPDLYYRLSEYPIYISPLNERKEDIPDLVRHFLDIERQENRTSISGISEQGLDLLMQQDWRGNVRQLRNAIRHALVLNMDQNGLLTADALAQYFVQSQSTQDDDRSVPDGLGETLEPQNQQGLYDALWPPHSDALPKGPDGQFLYKEILITARHSVEQKVLRWVLDEASNNKALAARLLQMDYKTLYSKLKLHKIIE